MRPDPRRSLSLLLGVALATAVAASPVAAQDETLPPEESFAPPSCDILTTDEVSTAFGETLALGGGSSGTSCQFDADMVAGRSLFVFTDIDEGGLDDFRTFMCVADASASPAPTSPPCTDLNVAGRPAIVTDIFGSLLYVAVGQDAMFRVQLVGDPIEGVDEVAAMSAIAELAIPRLGDLPQATAEPTETPREPDEELAALFPTDIMGSPITIQTVRGNATMSGDDPDVTQRVTDALTSRGKTIEDLSVGLGGTDDGAVQIIALRVRDTDIRPFVVDLLGAFIDGPVPSMEPQGVVPGKDVSSVTQDGEQVFVYPKDDILWLVAADGAALIETFARLP